MTVPKVGVRFRSMKTHLGRCDAGRRFRHRNMTIRPNMASGSYQESALDCTTLTANRNDCSQPDAVRRTPVPVSIKRVQTMNRKRRTVLWLYNEDYEYLSSIAEHDMDSKNVSMHRLVKALRNANIKSFLKLEEVFKRLPPPGKP